MKKACILPALLLAISMTACGTDIKTENDTTPATTTQDVVQAVEETATSTKVYEDIVLETDDTKAVFKDGKNQMVFYNDGENITGFETYVDCETEDLANDTMETLLKSNDALVDKATVNGKYLIIKYKEEAFKGLTVEDVTNTYSQIENSGNSVPDSIKNTETAEPTPIPEQTEPIPADGTGSSSEGNPSPVAGATN